MGSALTCSVPLAPSVSAPLAEQRPRAVLGRIGVLKGAVVPRGEDGRCPKSSSCFEGLNFCGAELLRGHQ